MSTKPIPSSQAASKRMKANGPRDTKPELMLRSLLHRRGLRFRVDQYPVKGLRRKADILFRSSKVAVFVDGCFWHGCPIHKTWPKANAEFWRSKIETNRVRDADTTEKLSQRDWMVLRFWEHEDTLSVAEKVFEAVHSRSSCHQSPDKTSKAILDSSAKLA